MKKQKDLQEWMSFKRDGERVYPLKIFEPDDQTVVGVYQGKLSEYDLLIRYRQKLSDDDWSRIRTPKHIHWAVDLLIKMHEDRPAVQDFLDFLIEIWGETQPIRDAETRKQELDIRKLLEAHKDKVEEYQKLSGLGEYKIEFLILLAKLLMLQEKTNMENAFMFKKLLDALKKGEGIFSIVSTATHR